MLFRRLPKLNQVLNLTNYHLCFQRPRLAVHLAPTLQRSERTLTSSAAMSAAVGPSSQREKPSKMQAKFCKQCGGNISLSIPEGDQEWRHVCTNCGFIDYYNPKMVVGCIVEHEGKILLCKRAIDPCRGKWTFPAGFMELHESSMDGARRETAEEANANVEGLAPYTHLDIPAIAQTYILFRAKLAAPYTYSPGAESLAVQFFEPHEIPFDQLAFSSVAITLEHYMQDCRQGTFRIHHGVIDKRPASSPNDPTTFTLRDHVAIPTQLPARL
ncbi:hypothetical protein WJX84_009653 [Apatococcus fuscideae]|uniref:Nudix hydrolase domain-containing protein n=1 Tax=Apatococcus fuscideae TaxID=2026836 RepID=A0AAW1STR2_9CHLO